MNIMGSNNIYDLDKCDEVSVHTSQSSPFWLKETFSMFLLKYFSQNSVQFNFDVWGMFVQCCSIDSLSHILPAEI